MSWLIQNLNSTLGSGFHSHWPCDGAQAGGLPLCNCLPLRVTSAHPEAPVRCEKPVSKFLTPPSEGQLQRTLPWGQERNAALHGGCGTCTYVVTRTVWNVDLLCIGDQQQIFEEEEVPPLALPAFPDDHWTVEQQGASGW